MKLTEHEFKLKKKLQTLIDFCIDSERSQYLINHTHAPGRKLRIKKNYNDDLTLSFGSNVFTLIHTEPKGVLGVKIYNTWFEIRNYDEDELFNLSTLHCNKTITLLKLYCTLDFKNYVFALKTIEYQIICDACNSIKTQYRKFERSNYA